MCIFAIVDDNGDQIAIPSFVDQLLIGNMLCAECHHFHCSVLTYGVVKKSLTTGIQKFLATTAFS